jgi:GTP-binding protein
MKITSVRFTKSVVELVQEISPIKEIKTNPQVFFLGRSNVGKSSLINSLFGKNGIARVSAQAGKTQTINFFEVNEKYECLDFPGYGYARGGQNNMERLRDIIMDYLDKNINHRVRIIQVIDAYVGPTDLDREVYGYLWSRGVDILLILNKADKTNQRELEETKRKVETDFATTPYILYSCTNSKFQDGALDAIFAGL